MSHMSTTLLHFYVWSLRSSALGKLAETLSTLGEFLTALPDRWSSALKTAEAGNPRWIMLAKLKLLLGPGVHPELMWESKAGSALL